MLLVSYVQTKCGKDTLKEFQEVSEVLNTSLNMKIWSFLKTAILGWGNFGLLEHMQFPLQMS